LLWRDLTWTGYVIGLSETNSLLTLTFRNLDMNQADFFFCAGTNRNLVVNLFLILFWFILFMK